jgi:hypothetical protein
MIEIDSTRMYRQLAGTVVALCGGAVSAFMQSVAATPTELHMNRANLLTLGRSLGLADGDILKPFPRVLGLPIVVDDSLGDDEVFAAISLRDFTDSDARPEIGAGVVKP